MKKSELPTANPYAYTEKIFANEGLITLSEDFSLPEQLDDAKRVVRCEAMLRPGGRYVNGHEVEYEGEIVYSVLYITDVNSIKNAVFKSAYSGKYTLPQAINDIYVTVLPTMDSASCKLVSVRKMNLRCNVRMEISAYKEASCEPHFEGESAQEDEQECEKKIALVPYTKVLSLEKRDCRVSRDVEIPSGEGNVKEIISCSVNMRACDIVSLSGSLQMKIEAVFSCLYSVMRDDEVEYRSLEKKYILENSVENPDMNEEYEGGAKIYCKELSVTLGGSDGDNKNIEIDFTYDICARLYGNDECNAVVDVYSCDYQSSADTVSLSGESFSRSYEGTADFNSVIDSPHTIQIIAPCALCVLRSVKYDGEENKLYADADIAVTAVTKDSDGRLGAFENTVPVRITFDAENANAKNGDVYISDFDISLNDGNIVIKGSVGFSCISFIANESTVVKNITVDRSSVRDKSGALPITFYYPEEGESLWDISKRYATTVELVRDANELSENENIGKKVLLIPQKRKKPLFSKVIGK